MTRPLMDNPSEPINDGTYFDSLEGVIDRSKVCSMLFLCLLLPLIVIVTDLFSIHCLSLDAMVLCSGQLTSQVSLK